MSHLEILDSELHAFQIDLPTHQKTRLAQYCEELVRWNKKINLTGLTGANMVRRLVVEPAWIGLQLKPEGTLADIGSGNGSPAVPLHVVAQMKKTHLIEARSRRAAFLRHLAAAMKLTNVTIHRARFQETARSLGTVDWITLQGVDLDIELLESMSPIAHKTTSVVWITSNVNPPITPVYTLRVPLTNTDVFLFRVDLS